MAHTDKDLPFVLRKSKARKKHGHLMRDNKMSLCPYGTKCCGAKAERWTARAAEKREWRKELVFTYKMEETNA